MHRDNEGLQEFIQFNDIGLPLAYSIAEGIVSSTPIAEGLINDTFDMLLHILNVEDSGFEDFNQIFEAHLNNPDPE
jgi:hypothetical protein